jgi:hypothetical protein
METLAAGTRTTRLSAFRLQAGVYLGLAAAIISTLQSCNPLAATQTTRMPTVLERIVRGYQCSPGLPEPTFLPDDSLTASERCALVSAARAAIGRSRDVHGVAASDTTLIANALVVPMAWADTNDTVLQASWVVSFSIPAHRWDDEVWIDRSNGAISMRHIHKPL